MDNYNQIFNHILIYWKGAAKLNCGETLLILCLCFPTATWCLPFSCFFPRPLVQCAKLSGWTWKRCNSPGLWNRNKKTLVKVENVSEHVTHHKQDSFVHPDPEMKVTMILSEVEMPSYFSVIICWLGFILLLFKADLMRVFFNHPSAYSSSFHQPALK